MEGSALRNLDEIQERDPGKTSSRLGALVLASLAGACIVFAVIAVARRPSSQAAAQPDPLAELAQKGPPVSSAAGASLDHQNVAFPNLLSDDPNPTTAMAALRNRANPAPADSSGLGTDAPPGSSAEPPPATDQLPVVPLPAQNYLSLSPVVTEPRDSLTAMANQVSTPDGEEAAEGRPGGYQLQVSSFRRKKTADRFATALRKRGHSAHVEPANVRGKGTWYRVRVGPFRSRPQAMNYRTEFERREHIVAFLVEPEKAIENP